MAHRGRTAYPVDRALAGMERQHGRPLNSIVRRLMHEIEALIGPLETLSGLGQRFPSTVIRELPQRFALVPITDALAKDLADAGLGAADPDPPPALEMAPGVAALAAELSVSAPVLYVATFFFGGAGGQDALVWAGGKLTLALCDNKGEMSEWPNSPISRALRSVGVKTRQGEDEFDALGLGSHRSNNGWARDQGVVVPPPILIPSQSPSKSPWWKLWK